MSYSVEEHTYLLSGMNSVTVSFNASESSLELKALYKLMVEQYYNAFGYNCRPLATLQSHFVNLYSAFKNGIRGLLLVTGAPKIPAKYVNGICWQKSELRKRRSGWKWQRIGILLQSSPFGWQTALKKIQTTPLHPMTYPSGG
jgi:hypothetical protein